MRRGKKRSRPYHGLCFFLGGFWGQVKLQLVGKYRNFRVNVQIRLKLRDYSAVKVIGTNSSVVPSTRSKF